VPGRYPEPAASRLYRNEGERFVYDAGGSAPFRTAGLVSGAAFGDLDADGDADALLATEWGPVRYFENAGAGRFADRTAALGLDGYTGWWNGVALGDVDGDGRLDVLATNWGWNGVHGRLHRAGAPLRLYHADFDADGVVDVVEAYEEPVPGGYVPVPGLSSLSEAMPYLRDRMPTFRQFAAATLRGVIGPKLDRAPFLEAGTLSHLLFLNRADAAGALRPRPRRCRWRRRRPPPLPWPSRTTTPTATRTCS
jgi:hypothetical protein